MIFSYRHRFHIVNGVGGKPFEWTPDQWAFLLPVRREVEFKERIVGVIVAKEEPGVCQRNHSGGVKNIVAIHLSERNRRDYLAVRLSAGLGLSLRRCSPLAVAESECGCASES